MTRLEQLWQFYQDDPEDPFNLYAYALELSKQDNQKAIRYLKQLIADKPDYIPSYYQVSVLCLENNEDARWMIEQGIEKAKAQNNRKAQHELQALLDDLD